MRAPRRFALRDPPARTVGDLDIVPGFGDLVHRMLAKACAERYQSMREVASELDVGPDTPQVWHLVGDVAQSHADIVALRRWLLTTADPAAELLSDIARGAAPIRSLLLDETTPRRR